MHFGLFQKVPFGMLWLENHNKVIYMNSKKTTLLKDTTKQLIENQQWAAQKQSIH